MLGTVSYAQDFVAPSQMDSIKIGNQFGFAAGAGQTLGSAVFEKSPEIDIAKALYGQFSGLLIEVDIVFVDRQFFEVKILAGFLVHDDVIQLESRNVVNLDAQVFHAFFFQDHGYGSYQEC